jgi:16S rRNA (adenine1518-N6/adenine1519-N6)-dimethyltransferase
LNQPPIRKRWGQNFINDINFINKIITEFNPKKNDIILEIGPGRGALTFPLSKIVKKIFAIEIDPKLVELLELNITPNTKIINNDILKYDLNTLDNNYKIIGNLPYYITTPIIFKFFENLNWNKMTIMVQKEVANRIIASPGHKNYGRLSIMIQAYTSVKKHFDISPSLFEPKPKIYSSLITLKPKSRIISNKILFNQIVKKAFQKRRKMLKNSLINFLTNDQIKTYGHLRPDAISVNDFIKISDSCIKE